MDYTGLQIDPTLQPGVTLQQPQMNAPTINPIPTAPTLGVDTALNVGGAAGTSTILGMQPANFAAIMGMIGKAIAPPNRAGARLGDVAQQMGQSKLIADAAGIQDAKNKSFMKEIIGSIGKNGMNSEGAMALLTQAHTPTGASPTLGDYSLLDNTPANLLSGAKQGA